MKKWLFIGILIRLLIIPLTFHPDLHFFVLSNYLVVYKQLWLGFYDFLGNSPDPVAQVLPAYAFTYPPLIILINGFFASVTYRLFDVHAISGFLIHPDEAIGTMSFYWMVFVTKVPYILPDLLLGYFLSKIAYLKIKKQKIKYQVFKLWMLNPFTLYATFAIGQFDVYPTLMVVIAVWLITRYGSSAPEIFGRQINGMTGIIWAAFFLGIGGAFKLFPLLFLPYLILKFSDNWKSAFKIFIFGSLGYLLPVLPYLQSYGFRTYALLAPQTEKMLYAKIPVSGAEYLSVFLVGYICLLLFAWNKKLEVWRFVASVLLLFYAVTHFHVQWMIWVSPWLILIWVRYEKLRWLLSFLFLLYLIIVFSFENSLNYGLFFPYNEGPNLIDLLPGFLLVEKFKYLSMVRSAFAGLNIFLIGWLVTNKKQRIT